MSAKIRTKIRSEEEPSPDPAMPRPLRIEYEGAIYHGGAALRLRRETTMTLAWIAGRLQMGVWTHVSNLLLTSPQKGAQPAKKRSSVNSEGLTLLQSKRAGIMGTELMVDDGV